MSLSVCEKCGGHISLGPHATNKCDKCGEGVFGEGTVATISKEKQSAYKRAVELLHCFYHESVDEEMHDFTDKDLDEIQSIIKAAQ